MSPSAQSHDSLRIGAITCHGLLAMALLISILAAGITASGLALLAASIAPLMLTLRGLLRGYRATERWLTVLLVAYVGITCVEVVARRGDAPLLSVALLAAVLELGLLLALIQRHPRRAPTAPE